MMTQFLQRPMLYFLISGVLLMASACRNEADISDLPNVYYDTDVQPIINANCTMCHGGYGTYDGLMGIVKAGKPHKSELYTRITNPWAALRMPQSPTAPLSVQQRGIINLWILQGAKKSSAQ